LIQSVKKAGIDFRVCGQGIAGRKIDPETMNLLQIAVCSTICRPTRAVSLTGRIPPNVVIVSKFLHADFLC